MTMVLRPRVVRDHHSDGVRTRGGGFDDPLLSLVFSFSIDRPRPRGQAWPATDESLVLSRAHRLLVLFLFLVG